MSFFSHLICKEGRCGRKSLPTKKHMKTQSSSAFSKSYLKGRPSILSSLVRYYTSKQTNKKNKSKKIYKPIPLKMKATICYFLVNVMNSSNTESDWYISTYAHTYHKLFIFVQHISSKNCHPKQFLNKPNCITIDVHKFLYTCINTAFWHQVE